MRTRCTMPSTSRAVSGEATVARMRRPLVFSIEYIPSHLRDDLRARVSRSAHHPDADRDDALVSDVPVGEATGVSETDADGGAPLRSAARRSSAISRSGFRALAHHGTICGARARGTLRAIRPATEGESMNDSTRTRACTIVASAAVLFASRAAAADPPAPPSSPLPPLATNLELPPPPPAATPVYENNGMR